MTTALMVTPAAAASLITRQLREMFLRSGILSVLNNCTGRYASHYLSVSSGGGIVLSRTSHEQCQSEEEVQHVDFLQLETVTIGSRATSLRRAGCFSETQACLSAARPELFFKIDQHRVSCDICFTRINCAVL